LWFGIDKFLDENNNYIEATSFWNSLYNDAGDISVDAFGSTNYKTSSWIEGSFYDDNDNNDTSYYDTFYVRTHGTTSVPEPSTLLIFALGLIAFASKKSRVFNTNK